MSSIQILRAAQSPRGTDKLKLTWRVGDERPRFEYLVSCTRLSKCVTGCREALHELLKTSEAPGGAGLPEALGQLAGAGAALYETLMPTDDGKPTGSSAFRRWFEGNVATAESGTWRVEFLYDGDQPIIPWGLTFPTSMLGRINGTSFEDYIDFWAHRYLTVSYPTGASGVLNPGGEEGMDGRHFQFSLLIEREPSTMEVDSRSLAEDLEIRIRGRLSDKLIRQVSKLGEIFKELRRWNHVVYVSLRADDDAYPLDDGKLTADQLKRITEILLNDGGGHAIAVIDRDAIIRDDRGKAWRSTFFSEEWAGLIAVETDVVQRRLWYEGFRFLTQLLSRGVPLANSLRDIRKELWPYSLLYGVYSNPDRVFFQPPPAIVAEMQQILEESRRGEQI